jgi:hypothetical protein
MDLFGNLVVSGTLTLLNIENNIHRVKRKTILFKYN